MFEFIPFSEGCNYSQNCSDAIETGGTTTDFTVNFEEIENPECRDMEYVACYPICSAGAGYGIPIDIGYENPFPNSVNYNNMPEHPIFSMGMPSEQHIRNGSFDPAADIMVSSVQKRKYVEGRPQSLNLSFARVGSIACFRLHGLKPGCELICGNIDFIDRTNWRNYRCVGRFIYDTYLHMASRCNDGTFQVTFLPGESESIHADENGDMTVFLRLISGAAYKMKLYLETYDDKWYH